MEKIDLNKIRGKWTEYDGSKGHIGIVAGGDDTIESIRRVAQKVNEIIDFINIQSIPPPRE